MKITFLGGGNMATALIGGLLERGFAAADLQVVELGEAARGALARGAATVDVAVTHALLVGDALQQLRAGGVREVWSTDSVPHASNVVSVAPLLARVLSSFAAPPPSR